MLPSVSGNAADKEKEKGGESNRAKRADQCPISEDSFIFFFSPSSNYYGIVCLLPGGRRNESAKRIVEK